MERFEYRQYLDEKKAYQKNLEEETNTRLQKIREKLNQPQASISESLPPKIDSKATEDLPNKGQRSLKSSILYYASFGYWNTQKSPVTHNTNKKN